jgi:uncharacterized damage-inducible protein DinB
MQPFAADFLSSLESQHAEIERAIDGLPPAALDWSPGPDMNTIVVLVVHLAGAERYFLGDVIAGEPSNRDRLAEFQTRELDADTLKARLQTATDYARRILDGLTLEDLEAMRTVPRDGSQRSVGSCLLTVATHTAMHAGHIQLTRQLWEQREQPQS